MEEYLFFCGNVSAAYCDGRLQYNMCSKVNVELNHPDVESALRQAWKQVRYEEPDIATILEDRKKVYVVPDKAAVEEWLSSTFIVDSTRDAEELWREGRALKPATLYWLPKTSEIVLYAHHANIDGVGAIMWWDKYFRALINPKPDIVFGDEYSRLTPALDEILGSPGGPTPEQSEHAMALFMEYVTKLPSIGLVSKVGKVPAGQCQSFEHVIDQETTIALVNACKKRGITVTSAVHAAYIGVLIKHADPASNTTRYTAPCEFNMRQYLPAPYSQNAASAFYVPLPFSIDLPATFSEISSVLNSYYRGSLRDNSNVLEVAGYYTRVLEQFVKTPEYQNAPIPTDALVSSMGIVENHLRRSYGDTIVVKDWRLAVDVVLGMTGLHFYSFRDQLRLVYQFNDGYEGPHKIKQYLEDLEKIMKAELLGLF
jgi:hypothetical protein